MEITNATYKLGHNVVSKSSFVRVTIDCDAAFSVTKDEDNSERNILDVQIYIKEEPKSGSSQKFNVVHTVALPNIKSIDDIDHDASTVNIIIPMNAAKNKVKKATQQGNSSSDGKPGGKVNSTLTHSE